MSSSSVPAVFVPAEHLRSYVVAEAGDNRDGSVADAHTLVVAREPLRPEDLIGVSR